MPQRVRGLGKRIHALWGGPEGESALASYRCTEAVFPVAGMVRRIPYTKKAFHDDEACASVSGLIWWASA